MSLVETFRKPVPVVQPLVPGVAQTDYVAGRPRIEWSHSHSPAAGSVGLKIGRQENSPAYFSPNGLRQFAEFLNALADQQDAAGK